MEQKYKLIKRRWADNHHMAFGGWFYQIQALRDIPRHGVKAGDMGGYVSSPSALSQEDDCWVGEGIVVQSQGKWDKENTPSVSGNALVRGSCYIKYSMISDDVVVDGRRGCIKGSHIADNAHLKGELFIVNSDITGSSVIEAVNSHDLEEMRIPRIKMVNSSFTKANIAGTGSIKNVSSDSKFELKDRFKLDFSANERIFRNVRNDFTASGHTNIYSAKKMHGIIKLSGQTIIINTDITCGTFTMNGGQVYDTTFIGNVDIAGKVRIKGARIVGENIFRDDVIVSPKSTFDGRNIVTGNALIPVYSIVSNEIITAGKATKVDFSVFDGKNSLPLSSDTMPENIMPRPAPVTIESSLQENPKLEIYRNTIKSVQADYEAYTTDIVKLIKYPAMGDASIPETQELMVSLRTAQRAMLSNNEENLEQSSKDVERTFVRAENNAIILANSFLDEKRKQNLKRAGQALSIALDESAGEHERRAGYKSGMKNLEGVLLVTEQAVSVLKERIGLKEIEA